LRQRRPSHQRKKARTRCPHSTEREDEDVATRDTPQFQQPDQESLGLYDDPDAGDEIHNDPLLHTVEGSSSESDSSGNADTSTTHARARLQRASSGTQAVHSTTTEYDAPLDPSRIYQESHPEWFGRAIITLIAILHAKHRVSFRACALILFSLNTILITLGVLHPLNPLPITLNTVIHRLDLHDRFTVYPICQSCHRIFPIDTSISAMCPDCDTRLFKPVSNRLFRRLTGRSAQRPPPVCAAPSQLPSSILAEFLARGDNELACDSWKTRTRTPGELKDISDGEIWQTIQGPDQKPFFSSTDDTGELRIGVTMSIDWYRAENLLIPFMTPGPTEPNGSQLQNYMKLVVDDLLLLYDQGVIYHTPLHPEGK
ncbi:hypothetical protein BV22DRAFT_965875, partial [Leucogyrophana mollusca]